jgi:hypothetical protein
MDTKFCRSCEMEHPVSEFYRNRNICKGADRARSRDRYQADKGRLSQEIRARRFSMTVRQLEEFLAPGCAICGTHEDLVVDHDHSCCPRKGYSCGDCLRSPLCRNHNRGLAYFEGNLDYLRAALRYLEK